ncbi:hypothetical protein BTK96_004889 [Burkholderia pyrrocinia]|uniref:hypothetical protein n=1 Tax=Burkholderia TaxID=32008 RepID=UPI0005079606|nr:hypothetical protein [Burkholderia pyrrocinia]EKS9887868.1 hypothetical protein [Burkholderia pyrrocinia]EKS9892577.1 hypothetical protein [Burkholderia pyrrocinia]EKS9906680.1 hypothetical protein [Burkholderia pyrrocinia]KFL52854.1 hypothetical protein JM78_15890 [Burkholderia pyrrocinia]
MACPTRFADVVRASAPSWLPDGRATPQRSAARRRAKLNHDAGRGTIACRAAWPDFAASDAAAGERES